jgi:prepilin-type N-terminal cleavage/methylation domain-containing protein
MVSKSSSQKQRGFTLVEIVLVMSMLAVIMIGAVTFAGAAGARDDKKQNNQTSDVDRF